MTREYRGNTNNGAQRRGATRRRAIPRVGSERSGERIQASGVGGWSSPLSLSLSFSPGQTQVAGRPDNARSLDKAPLIVPISDEEWTAGLPLTISFVICIRLIKITMSAKPRRCCARAARRWPTIARMIPTWRVSRNLFQNRLYRSEGYNRITSSDVDWRDVNAFFSQAVLLP